MLALLNGILSTILGVPGINALQSAMELAGGIPTNDPDTVRAFGDAVTGNILWLVLNQITSTLALAFCLVPWVRLFFFERDQVMAGGLADLVRRSLRSFVHLIAALGLGVLLMGLIVSVITALTAGLGVIGLIVAIIAIGFSIWAAAALAAVSHMAVFQEAIDLPVGLISMIIRLKHSIALFTASYIALFLIVSLIGVIIATLFGGPLPVGVGIAISNSITGAASFLVSAIFIAGAVKTSLFVDTDA